MDSDCVKLGIAGLGGYAASVRAAVLEHMKRANPAMRLVAVCDPQPAAHGEAVAELRGAGAELCDSFEQMLDRPLDVLWLPLPIHLHRAMTEQALAAGKAVMCEKPPAGCVDDLDAMRVARDRAKLPLAFGYQDIYQPSTMRVKRMLLAGVLGRIRSASVYMGWPRGTRYYGRNDWAGKFKRNGTWVMDSPANNAMAHYINLPLFLMGPAAMESATPVMVEAELYRGNPSLENFDTMSMRVHLEGDKTLLVHYTHATTGGGGAVVIRGEKGTLRRTTEEIVVEISGQPAQHLPTYADGDRSLAMQSMIDRLAKLVRGQEDPDVAVSTPENARAHLVAVNGASEASAVHPVPPSAVEPAPFHHDTLTHIRGIEQAMQHCDEHGLLLHESGMLEWTKTAGKKDLRGYKHFGGPRD